MISAIKQVDYQNKTDRKPFFKEEKNKKQLNCLGDKLNIKMLKVDNKIFQE